MADGISTEVRSELLGALRQRYREASKKDKKRILDEFVALAGCHRKHAIRLLARNGNESGESHGQPAAGRRLYDEAVREALVVIWEASDRICGKRLKAVLPGFIEAMERHGHLDLDTDVRSRLLRVSAATIDRLLKPVRDTAGSRRRTRRKRRLSPQVPIRTFDDWDEPPPGFLEIDLVAHCGGVLSGSYIHSLVATDVCSGWTEAVPLLAREQSLVAEGIEVIGEQLPISIRGIDSDNDSAFINDTLVAYCANAGIEFTRSRAYRKNDQAWIEQKNGAFVRRFVGYERFSGPVAAQTLAQLYRLLRLYVNYFQPSFKLIEKRCDGARTVKRYDKPTTPCDRLLANESLDVATNQGLRERRATLDPIALLHNIREAQSALAALASLESPTVPARENLERFLSRLPTLWRQGEVRPTHMPRTRRIRAWRTRKDPFEGVWSDVLGWLQQEPDVTAKTLFERLQAVRPGQFPDGQLRTLQRRVRDWRALMAKELVYGVIENADKGSATAIRTDD